MAQRDVRGMGRIVTIIVAECLLNYFIQERNHTSLTQQWDAPEDWGNKMEKYQMEGSLIFMEIIHEDIRVKYYEIWIKTKQTAIINIPEQTAMSAL